MSRINLVFAHPGNVLAVLAVFVSFAVATASSGAETASLAVVKGGTLTITTKASHGFKGWGITPAPFDRQPPTLPPAAPGGEPQVSHGDTTWLPQDDQPTALHHMVCDLGFEIARVYLTPTMQNAEGSLVPQRVQDLKDHLTILARCGVKKYIVTVWSPPAHLKSPDKVRWGKFEGRVQTLDPRRADDFADFYVAVLADLRKAGFPPPLAVSAQNEPSTSQPYDCCNYGDSADRLATYREVVKVLRNRLDKADFKDVPILAPETEALHSLPQFLGEPKADGFAAMQADATFARAVGGFAWHTYATSGDIAKLNAAMAAYPGRDRWMTEYCQSGGIRGELRAKSGNSELDLTLDYLRRMAGDIVDTRCNYWFFWRGWHVNNGPSDQDLTTGTSPEHYRTFKAYRAFQKLWTTVRGGAWQVMTCATTDSPLRTDNRRLIEENSGDQWSAPVDIIAFQSGNKRQTCLLVVNAHAEPLSLSSIAGLCGSKANVFVTTQDGDMVAQPPRSVVQGNLVAPLELPAWSAVLIVSEP